MMSRAGLLGCGLLQPCLSRLSSRSGGVWGVSLGGAGHKTSEDDSRSTAEREKDATSNNGPRDSWVLAASFCPPRCYRLRRSGGPFGDDGRRAHPKAQSPEGMTNGLAGGCLRLKIWEAFSASVGYDVCICVHAEQNAVITAARFGNAIE